MVAVPLSDVVASNERIASTFPNGLVAVFVGGTNGIGEQTVKAMAKYASKPRIYIVGRSQEAAKRIIDECQQLNPGGHFEFLQADVSLIKVVDEVCRKIEQKEPAINILVLSTGSMDFRKHTSEGIRLSYSLGMHARIRFVVNLLPRIQAASSLRRVVSVLAGTCEGPVDTTNLSCEGFSLFKQRDQVASCQTLFLERVAAHAPDVSFIHNAPGVVNSGISREANGGTFLHVANFFARIMGPWIWVPLEETGERHLCLATSARYPSSQGSAAGVPVSGEVAVSRGSNGKAGSGVYSIDHKGNWASPKAEETLAGLNADGTSQKFWDFIMADLKRITGSEPEAARW